MFPACSLYVLGARHCFGQPCALKEMAPRYMATCEPDQALADPDDAQYIQSSGAKAAVEAALDALVKVRPRPGEPLSWLATHLVGMRRLPITSQESPVAKRQRVEDVEDGSLLRAQVQALQSELRCKDRELLRQHFEAKTADVI